MNKQNWPISTLYLIYTVFWLDDSGVWVQTLGSIVKLVIKLIIWIMDKCIFYIQGNSQPLPRYKSEVNLLNIMLSGTWINFAFYCNLFVSSYLIGYYSMQIS